MWILSNPSIFSFFTSLMAVQKLYQNWFLKTKTKLHGRIVPTVDRVKNFNDKDQKIYIGISREPKKIDQTKYFVRSTRKTGEDNSLM